LTPFSSAGPELAADDFEAVVRRADPDRWLATRFISDPTARADVLTLYAFDHELARAERVASNSLIAEIRLTWWREVVDEAFAGRPARAHPLAQALTEVVRRRGLSRARLEAMIDARVEALDRSRLDRTGAAGWAEAVGGSAAVLAARILDPEAPPEAAVPAGKLWGLAMLNHRGLIAPELSARELTSALADASRAARKLGVAAFPAVIYATLLRGQVGTREAGALANRLRLFWAAATGIL
jgi:phytoene synthase